MGANSYVGYIIRQRYLLGGPNAPGGVCVERDMRAGDHPRRIYIDAHYDSSTRFPFVPPAEIGLFDGIYAYVATSGEGVGKKHEYHRIAT